MKNNIVSEIAPILQSFETLTLEELESANMLERKDLKFVFPVDRAKEVVEKMLGHYRVLEVKGYRYTDYETVYYDTNSFKFYFQHHNDNLNRVKIRTRRYVQSDITFYEIKSKNNKGWVSKERIPAESLFLDINKVYGHEFGEHLEPKLKIDYVRMTFLSNDGDEKLTLDFNLKLNHYCPTRYYDNIVIAEMKAKDFSNNTFPNIIKGMQIDPMGISKYCLGVTHMFPAIKQNNFKQKLLKIKKIERL